MTVPGGLSRGDRCAGIRDPCIHRFRHIISAENIPPDPVGPDHLRHAVRDPFLPAVPQRTGGRRHAIASIIDKPLPFDKVPSHYVRMVSVVAVPAVKEHSGKK